VDVPLSLIKATSIWKSFAGVKALRGACFDLRAGEVHALVGENGAGKTTLIKVITGAVRPDSGTLEIDGLTVTDNDPQRARSLGVVAIYQQPALFPQLTVAENIAFETEPKGVWRRINWLQRHARARELLGRIGAHIDSRALVSELSMPQQQLVEIARALGASARTLIFDEPTASLSEQEVARLFMVVGELRAAGVGIIYISHRLDELFQVSDRITVMRDGATIATQETSDVGHDSLIRLVVGKELSAPAPSTERVAAQADGSPIWSFVGGRHQHKPGVCATRETVLLEVRHLSCKATGLRDISLDVRAGEILGVAGLVGSGRTDLARALFGLEPWDTGDVMIGGLKVLIRNPSEAIRSGLALVPEDRRRHGVIAAMPVLQNMTLAALGGVSRMGFIDGGAEKSMAEVLTRELAVKTPSIYAATGNLSGGNQQKVALGRWLATDPSVLILDEPTQGVDVGSKSEIHRLIKQLAERGKAIIVISSDWPELLDMSDRITVMREGTIAGMLDRSEATQERLLGLAFGHSPGSAK
jgi:rhamnose transport system ATP-binding protein